MDSPDDNITLDKKNDLRKLIEEDDETSHTSEVACSGGQCDIVKM